MSTEKGLNDVSLQISRFFLLKAFVFIPELRDNLPLLNKSTPTTLESHITKFQLKWFTPSTRGPPGVSPGGCQVDAGLRSINLI